MKTNKIALDIGNTRIKLFDGIQYDCIYNETDFILLFNNYLEQKQYKIDNLVYSSVNPYIEKQILKIAKNHRIECINTLNIFQKQNRLIYQHITGIGADRINGMFAAISYFKPPLITIDFGTATTINIVDEQSKCLGGIIMAGVVTQMNSLTNHTALLSNIRLHCPCDLIGDNTQDAIRSGIINGHIAMIDGLIHQIKNLYFKDINNLPIFITGGNSLLVYEGLTNLLKTNSDKSINYIYKQYLVLDGIWELFNSI